MKGADRMSKKLRLSAALAVVFVLVSVLSVNFIVNDEKYNANAYALTNAEFNEKLSSLYAEYDGDCDSVDQSDEYALKRIMVSNFNGNDYGAAECLYDSENDFAVLQFESSEKAEKACEKMKKDGVCAEPDGLAFVDGEKGTFCPSGSETVGTTSFINNYAMAADDVIVAVIDTGVMYDHTYIADRFYSTGYDLSSDACDDAYYDTTLAGNTYGHSTFVCGVIADNTPDTVKVLPYKVVPFGDSASSASSVISAINSAVAAGASVINISLHTTYGEANYQKAINKALLKGVCICASAPNSGALVEGAYPACNEGVITVSAMNGTELRATSGYGECIDFAAPGTNIHSTFPLEGGGSGFVYWSGTSFSTPYVAAVCADIKTVDCTLSKDEVYDTVCDFSADYGDTGYDIYFGNGVPNIGDMTYTDSVTYDYNIPSGVLNIHSAADYTAETQPWKRFSEKLTEVNVDSSVERIGDYAFYDMKSAEFTMAQTYNNVGTYAFYGCEKLTSFTFGEEVESVGSKAFSGIEGFELYGYRNTPAEERALADGLSFVSLGCKHSYIYEVFEADGEEPGYTVYTCTVCGDTHTGEYIEPELVDSGTCGENLTFRFDNTGKLTIDGSGDMYSYTDTNAPWYNYADEIKVLSIKSDVESVSPFAFYGCNIAIIRCSSANSSLSSDGTNLVDASGKLVLTSARGEYTVPDWVSQISAPAFIMSSVFIVAAENGYSTVDGLVYDSTGNIVMALPSYCDEVLTLDENVGINPYAFILTQYPKIVNAYYMNNTFGEYSIGYYLSGEMNKSELTFITAADSASGVYATENGFEINSENIGSCGENLTYLYDSERKALTLYGSGDMTVYASVSEVPWCNLLPDLDALTIPDGVTSLSPYAFYGASELDELTLPLSISAFEDDTTWYNCINIKKLTLTQGSGYSDDYVKNEVELYKFTPWYLSRKSITSMSISPDVKYIGVQMFRNSLALTELYLNCCEEIGYMAFCACSNLNDVRICSKNTVINDYAVFSYSTGYKLKMYSNQSLYGYCDSTAKDYCESFGVTLIPLGCGHSRDTELLNTENTAVFKIKTYHCNDCDFDYCVYELPDGEGSPLAVSAYSTSGVAVPNAEVYINGVYCGLTDGNGALRLEKVLYGAYPVELKVGGYTIFEGNADITEGVDSLSITLRFADFNGDSVVNAKDFAIYNKLGLNGSELFDYGRINDDNCVSIN